MVVSAMPKGPPNYKYAKEARIPLGTPGSAAGTREDPFVDCYKAASRAALAGGVASAQLGRHDTENLRKPLLYAPPRLPRPFEAIKYLSFAAIGRN